MLTYTFTEDDVQAAHDEWGANCGPTALAFALQIPLDDVRDAIPGFDDKRYTSPTMMRQALEHLGRPFQVIRPADRSTMFQWSPSLVRVQWTGPWTAPNANPRWAYRHTHWIATYMVERQAAMLFDCNGGIRGFQSWQDEIVPLLTNYDRADGGWHPTHVWKLI